MRVLVLDENLCDVGGHNFEYAMSIQRECERRGYQCIVYANSRLDISISSEASLRPVFPIRSATLHQEGLFRNSGRAGQLLRLLYCNLLHLYGLLFRVRVPRRDAIVLISCVSPRVSIAYMLWFFVLTLRGVKASILTVLHDRAPWYAKWELAAFRIAGAGQRINTAAQSSAIAADYYARFGENIDALPMPQVQWEGEVASLAEGERVPGRALRVVYLGLASSAKGFAFLVNCLLSERLIQSSRDRLRFTIQCHPVKGDAESAAAAERLSACGAQSPTISLLTGPISTRTFRQNLRNADVVVLPYDPRRYQFIQSGILTAAIAAGLPVIVSAGSALASEMESQGSGVSFEFGSPASFLEALEAMLRNFEAYQKSALSSAATYRSRHGAGPYVNLLEHYSL